MTGRWVEFTAYGHGNVRATHRTTLELTREKDLTLRGDCIIAVSSEVGAGGLPEWFKEGARKPASIIVMVLCTRDVCDSLVGHGHPQLSLTDPDRLVVRKSGYIDGKTLMVRASKSAADLRRDLVEELKRGAPLRVYLTLLGTP